MKTFSKILATRPWVKYIDDERAEGNSIIVTLSVPYTFCDDPGCGVRGFDSVQEVEINTRKGNVEHTP
jgi:hypothetical protein